MPQMAPLKWLSLFLIFSLFIIFSANKIWYTRMHAKNIDSEQSNALKSTPLYWKWY